MICIATKNSKLAAYLKAELDRLKVSTQVVDLRAKDRLEKIYDEKNIALIVDDEMPGIPRKAAVDVFNSLGRRLPVIMLQEHAPTESIDEDDLEHVGEQVTVLKPDQKEEILATLKVFGGVDLSGIKSHCEAIPYYNIQIPIAMLRENGGLGILTVDASSLSKIGMEYGPDVYSKVKEVFQSMLFNMWGKEGCFRDSDVIVRKSLASNVFIIFMSRSRGTGNLPLPGVLEKVADRLGNAIQNELWHELCAPGNKRKIPSCVTSLPLIGVGFFGVMNNPCIEIQEIVESGIEASRGVAVAQLRRVRDRQRELMQTLIQSDEYLYPHFQAVFHLGNLTEQDVEEVRRSGSIASIKDHLYGFEALIRVDKNAVENNLQDRGAIGIDPQYLRPDVLFSIAKSSKVSLELDQACLRNAAVHSTTLPGTLMVNILPRNLYYIDRLNGEFEGRQQIIFEVSESEAINNFELMLKARTILESKNMGIAADDFGKGYASLERIIKIKPNLIKFDRSMIQDIHEDPVKQAYVRGLVKAGKILNTLVLAEGVEKWEEAKILQEMGIELIQGFLLHKPQAVAEIHKQISEPKAITKIQTVA